MNVIAIPCLQDNYAYLIVCEETGQAAIVDPSEFLPVWQAIEQHGVELVAILNTHHHWDHTGGNQELLQHKPDLAVYAHTSDQGRVPGQTIGVKEGDTISIGALQGTLTHNPGHTTGAVSYYFQDAIFTGDTLFAAGCGRLFEGSPEDMYYSLNEKIGQHPSSSNVYFGHEYTLKNLRFAQSVEPGNPWIQERFTEVQALRAQNQFSTPSTLAWECRTNPFMRCDSAEIQETIKKMEPANDLSPISVLRVLRAMKDKF